MRVNIENCNNTGGQSAKEWVLGELVRNLKELRDRTDAGDIKALDEFFGLFVFNDDHERKKVGAGKTAHQWICPRCKVDRFKENCKGDRMTCPMVGVAHNSN